MEQFDSNLSNINKLLQNVSFSINKCKLIADNLSYLIQEFKQMIIKNSNFCSSREMKLFYSGCSEFIIFLTNYQDSNWLSNFINLKIHDSYYSLRKVWNIFNSISNKFCLPCFLIDNALYFFHIKDLAHTYKILSNHLQKDPNIFSSFTPVIKSKLSQILYLLKQPPSIQDLSNSKIIEKQSWTVIRQNIGIGGYAVVHLAKMKKDGQLVAVKELKVSKLTPRRLEFLRREIAALSMSNHSNLLSLTGVTVTPPFCIVTPYISNASLYDLIHPEIAKMNPILSMTSPDSSDKVPELIEYINSQKKEVELSFDDQTNRCNNLSFSLLEIARGLEYIHAIGIIHRDIKPLNILIDYDGRSVISDFGLSRFEAPCMSGDIGTVQWMAPEMLKEDCDYDSSIDIYSFAMIIFEILSGTVPFNGVRKVQVAWKLLYEDARPILPENVIKNNEAKNLISLMKKCWDTNPKNRPTSGELVEILSSGDYLVPGTNKQWFIQKMEKTKNNHLQALERLIHIQPEELLFRLPSSDPLIVPIMKEILKQNIFDLKLFRPLIHLIAETQNPEISSLGFKIIDNISNPKTCDNLTRNQVQPTLNKNICSESFINPDDFINEILDPKIWSNHSEKIIEYLHLFTKNLTKRGEIIAKLLQLEQNDKTIDAFKLITDPCSSINEFIFDPDLINISIIHPIFSYLIQKFHTSKKLIWLKLSFQNELLLNQFLNRCIKRKRYSPILLKEKDAMNVQTVLQYCQNGKMEDNAKFVLELFNKAIIAAGPSLLSLRLIKAELLVSKKKSSFFPIIVKSFQSSQAEIVNIAISIYKLQYQLFSKEEIMEIWDSMILGLQNPLWKEPLFNDILNELANIISQNSLIEITNFWLILFRILLKFKDLCESAPFFTIISNILLKTDYSKVTFEPDQSFWNTTSSYLIHFNFRSAEIFSSFIFTIFSPKINPFTQVFMKNIMNFVYLRNPSFDIIKPLILTQLEYLKKPKEIPPLMRTLIVSFFNQLPIRYPAESFEKTIQELTDQLKKADCLFMNDSFES